ncbi:helix-turn-helix domain-containing protein [Streptomyces resistomycificus]|uniref:helix-turn-helix domain-containing protein n=1 Tax=Streptomyces resistomycificus TaxID=67356 RepID=UPI00099793C2|nr:helix-turn-helix transcriptional regulator [Streptomyces resistomycificus]
MPAGKVYIAVTTGDVNPLSDRATLALPSGRGGAEQGPLSDLDLLTDREKQVLSLLADGPSNRVMARQLGIAERTVKAHLTSLMRKLNIESRLEAALFSNLHRDELPHMDHCPEVLHPEG